MMKSQHWAGSSLTLSAVLANPSAAAREVPEGQSFSEELARKAIKSAIGRYQRGREYLFTDDTDRAIADLSQARSEFMLGALCGTADEGTLQLVTGYVASATALIAARSPVSEKSLRRGIEYMKISMALGNSAPEALGYQGDLYELAFYQSQDEADLEKALSLKTAAGDDFAAQRLKVTQSLFRYFRGRMGPVSRESLLEALAASRPERAVEYVQRAILSQVVEDVLDPDNSIGLPGGRLTNLPYGLLRQFADIDRVSAEYWVGRVLSRLQSIQHDLESRGRKNNNLAQDLIVRLHGVSRRRALAIFAESDAARAAVAYSNLLPTDGYATWRRSEAEMRLAMSSHSIAEVVKAVEEQVEIAEDEDGWLSPLLTAAEGTAWLARSGHHPPQAAEAAWLAVVHRVQGDSRFELTGLSKRAGSGGVFSIDDARGELEATYVFKFAEPPTAEMEVERLRRVDNEITASAMGDLFEVPSVLALVPSSTEWSCLIQRRASGRTLLEAPKAEVDEALESAARFLGLIHRSDPPVESGRSAWGNVRKRLKRPSAQLFGTDAAAAFLDRLRDALPADAPVVVARDGHADNWLASDEGRVVAVDLEASTLVPAGWDLAQLIEDRSLVPVSDDGWRKRRELLDRYSAEAFPDREWPSDATYEWCAISRALWAYTFPDGRRRDAAHAQALAAWIASKGSEVMSELAGELAEALSGTRIATLRLTDVDVGLSRAMARLLRHHAPTTFDEVDATGFVAISDLARELGVSDDDVLDVALHPDEPRFEVSGDRIRARYGHSFPVKLWKKRPARPSKLFHGTSAESLDAIFRVGLRSMDRNVVHLSVAAEDALTVARRRPKPVVLEVLLETDADVFELAPGTWGAVAVPPGALRLMLPSTRIVVPVKDLALKLR